MRKEDICDACAWIDDRYLVEADLIRSKNTSFAYYVHRFGYIFLIPVTLCFVLAFQLMQPNLVPLHITDMDSSGHGVITAYAKDLNTFLEENPWNADIKINKLPVYKNEVTFGEHVVSEKRKQQMNDCLQPLAQYFHATEYFQTEDYSQVSARNDEVEISVDENLSTLIYFYEPVDLPETYTFYSRATKEELYNAGQYLTAQYQDILHFKDPVIVAKPQLSLYDPQSFELTSYELFAYEGDGSIEDKMLNYGTKRVQYYCNEKHQLDGIRIYYTDTEEMIGEYPILSIQEAKDVFLQKKTKIKDKDILKVELVYEHRTNQEYVMPYYKFYVNNEDNLLVVDIPDDIHQMEVYSIPAVQTKYIEQKE